MNSVDFITELYCQIDDALPAVPQHPQAIFFVSVADADGVGYAMQNVKQSPCCHWIKDNDGSLN